MVPSGAELMVIFLVALIVLGPQKLPEVARQLGRFMGEVRRMNASFQAELRDALHEPVDGTPRLARPPSASDPDAERDAVRHRGAPGQGNGANGA